MENKRNEKENKKEGMTRPSCFELSFDNFVYPLRFVPFLGAV